MAHLLPYSLGSGLHISNIGEGREWKDVQRLVGWRDLALLDCGRKEGWALGGGDDVGQGVVDSATLPTSDRSSFYALMTNKYMRSE